MGWPFSFLESIMRFITVSTPLVDKYGLRVLIQWSISLIVLVHLLIN
jgi:hypothetical protein